MATSVLSDLFTQKDIILWLMGGFIGILGLWLGFIQYFLVRQVAKLDKLAEEVTLIREHRITRQELHDELARLEKGTHSRFTHVDRYLDLMNTRLEHIINMIRKNGP